MMNVSNQVGIAAAVVVVNQNSIIWITIGIMFSEAKANFSKLVQLIINLTLLFSSLGQSLTFSLME